MHRFLTPCPESHFQGAKTGMKTQLPPFRFLSLPERARLACVLTVLDGEREDPSQLTLGSSGPDPQGNNSPERIFIVPCSVEVEPRKATRQTEDILGSRPGEGMGRGAQVTGSHAARDHERLSHHESHFCRAFPESEGPNSPFLVWVRPRQVTETHVPFPLTL